jgi:uncharacterized protein DUF5695
MRFNLYCLLVLVAVSGDAQSPWVRLARRPSTLGLGGGFLELHTPGLRIRLVRSSQTVASLGPAGFDFTPGDSLRIRSSDGMYHLGDITLRIRNDSGGWTTYSSAARRKPVEPLAAGGKVLAAADMAATFPDGMPLRVQRYWELDEGELTLRFALTNTSPRPIEIGSLGMPMIFNNLLDGKTLEQAHAQNVLYDPYTGGDGGYLQVTRLSGEASSLIVVPYGHTPFEAYNPLLNDPTPRGITFEGFYEWLVCSKAYAENEWKTAQPWNEATSIVLRPGETRSYGVQFLLSGTARDIEKTLIAHKRPVAVGIPGYVVPMDVDARLFLDYTREVRKIEVEPAGALEIAPAAPVLDNVRAVEGGVAGGVGANARAVEGGVAGGVGANARAVEGGVAGGVGSGWKAYAVHGRLWGRARLSITYADGLVQTIQYKVIEPEKKVVASYGHFLTTEQWFDRPGDIFHRSPGVITYDEEKKAQVVQDNRVWIAGMSDEGGAGSWLGAVMKQLVLPDKMELEKLEAFADQTLWGHIQYDSGVHEYGVRKSLFYYAPDSLPKGTYDTAINFRTWSAWPLKEAASTGRSYDYPHVAAAWWVLYRLARYHEGLVSTHPWDWYLEHAQRTILAMVDQAPYYSEFGQMEGTVFYLILRDLRAEGLTDRADAVEAVMKKRALHWRSLQYPFGSEMPWDSTGQEEVYMWSLFFGYSEKADVTLKAILAYMPTVPSWAYNGNARRYWDFLYAGKLKRIERMIHHYGSELNAIPVLTEYRRKGDIYLLRVGYGGVLGGISNIDRDGFAPCAFHSFPATLANDGISGDYGSGFFGYAVNTATYLVKDRQFGWLGFGGNVTRQNDWITAEVTTAGRAAAYIAPVGLWLRLPAGRLVSVSYQAGTGAVKLVLEPGDAYTPEAYLQVEQPMRVQGVGDYTTARVKERGMYEIPLGKAPTTVYLNVKKPN